MKWFILTTLLCALSAIAVRADNDNAAGAGNQEKAAAHSYKNIDVAEFEKLRTDKSNVVLDVRTPKEFAAGHIPGAVNLNFYAPDFDKKLQALDPKKTYLVHCASGGRSAKACGKMSGLDFPSLYNLRGGFKAWEKAGNKAEH
jgi:rhodanese-related sulfurtransferase